MSDVVAVRPPEGTPCWVSLIARDMAVTQDFYGPLLGWQFQSGPQRIGPYRRATLAGARVAGVGVLTDHERLPVGWTTYFAADSADEVAQRVAERGGTVAVGPLNSDGAGRLLIATDPEGAVFGVWQGREHVGAAQTTQPGTFGWNELLSRDAPALARFYANVFRPATADASTSSGTDTASGRQEAAARIRLEVDGRPVATVRDADDLLPPGAQTRWMTVFRVSDVSATMRHAEQLGGAVVLAPTADGPDITTGTLVDPQGAVFRVRSSSE